VAIHRLRERQMRQPPHEFGEVLGVGAPVRNLGVALAHEGQRVLLVDLDPQANLTTSAGIDLRQLHGSTYNVLVQGATRLIKASIERLSTARVKFKLSEVEHNAVGEPTTTRGEVTIGFLSNFGWRERKRRGVAVNRDNYVQLDQAIADLIRDGQFTFLRAEVLRDLRRQPLALKLYAWARTHKPDDRGRIFYGMGKLAKQLGCSDQNSTRRRRKLLEAVEALCQTAPEEFPGFEVKPGRHDQTLVLRKAKSRRPALLPAASSL